MPRGPYKTHCKHGHPRTPENVQRNGECRVCVRERQRRIYERDYRAVTPNEHRVTGPRT